MSKRFLERFPQFGEEIDDRGRALINLALKEAELELNPELWGELFEAGCFCLAADKLIQTPLGEQMRNLENPTEKTVFALEFERLCGYGSTSRVKYIKDDKREQKRFERLLAKMENGPHVAVGILQDDKVDDKFSMVDLAVVHEYGSKIGHIPSRSFIRSTCDAKQKKHLKLIEKLRGRILEGRLTMKQALTTLGEVVSKDMVQTINRGIRPKLKTATIKRKKGSSKALIDTGRLKGSITHEVRGSS